MNDFRRPSLPGPLLFEAQEGGHDPAEAAAAGHRIAALLVRGPNNPTDAGLVDRVTRLADTEGLGVIAELWATAPADTVAGSLWRLYLLRTWVHRQPAQAAREFAAGRTWAPVADALAGLVDPPSPDDVVRLVDTVVGGIVRSDFDVILDRAAAFAQVVAVGRGHLDSGDPVSAARLFDLATQLRHAAALERRSQLH
ncbi:hypothetical protein HMPREF0063_10538 [Aeromicrobium marinum DSM 15272]|uniref:Uncharacterized protein n=1 Tax=Aeromicrobium marinum DSM 15272 TaxID=585531 RepID=E2S998_9ACTN|nr:hypothetical protein [Aeromicrobium marinum]EFQ83822.1 hypothetical protein HMPREF0063_10538 [Aeromicrobium marinum DSM 15272]